MRPPLQRRCAESADRDAAGRDGSSASNCAGPPSRVRPRASSTRPTAAGHDGAREGERHATSARRMRRRLQRDANAAPAGDKGSRSVAKLTARPRVARRAASPRAAARTRERRRQIDDMVRPFEIRARRSSLPRCACDSPAAAAARHHGGQPGADEERASMTAFAPRERAAQRRLRGSPAAAAAARECAGPLIPAHHIANVVTRAVRHGHHEPFETEPARAPSRRTQTRAPAPSRAGRSPDRTAARRAVRQEREKFSTRSRMRRRRVGEP